MNISKGAEKLLRDILRERNENGSCNVDFWKKRFNLAEGSEEHDLRYYFKELSEVGMIKITWADNLPMIMRILPKGENYFYTSETQNKNLSYNISNYYGGMQGVVIQQGIIHDNTINIGQKELDEDKIQSLIQMIEKYKDMLQTDYGAEDAKKLQEASIELRKETSQEKKRGILSFMRDLSVNACGGLIAGGILQLIDMIL